MSPMRSAVFHNEAGKDRDNISLEILAALVLSDLGVLAFSIDVHGKLLQVFKSFLHLLDGGFKQVITNAPCICAVRLLQCKIRITLQLLSKAIVKSDAEGVYRMRWCSSCAQAFFRAACHSASVAGVVDGPGSWYLT